MGSLFSSGTNSTDQQQPSKFKFKSDLNDQQIKAIRSSWGKVLPNKEEHGKLLFYKVFEMAPHLKDLFPFGSDLTQPQFTEHALRVMNTIDLAVKNLDNPDVLVPALKELGRVHAMFQLTNREFEYVGQALLSVLEEGLGEAFTPALKAAWTDLYAIITDIMVTAITDYNADKKDNKTNKEY